MKSRTDVLEDLQWLDSTGVGAADAAKRTDFPTPHAMERWLHRHNEYPLWLRMKARDPEGMHDKANRSLFMTENTSTDNIAALINKAQESGRKRTRTKADRLSGLVADLRRTLDIEEHEDRAREVARKDVERLQRELADAKARLKGGASPVVDDGPTPADIREWARDEGVPCPERGRVPEAVREAYLEATEQQAS